MEINETLRTDPADQGARQKKKEDDQAIVSAISAPSVDFGLIQAFQKGFVSHPHFFGTNQYVKGQIILLDKPIDFSYLLDNEIVLENSPLREYVKSTH